METEGKETLTSSKVNMQIIYIKSVLEIFFLTSKIINKTIDNLWKAVAL